MRCLRKRSIVLIFRGKIYFLSVYGIPRLMTGLHSLELDKLRSLTWFTRHFFWIVLVSFATEIFGRKFEFLDFFLQKLNIRRAPKTSMFSLSLIVINYNANLVSATIHSTFGYRNFSWRTVNWEISSKFWGNLRFWPESWAFWSQRGLICGIFCLMHGNTVVRTL